MSRPLTLPELDRLLAHAERAAALLERCRPLNGPEALDRTLARWNAGEPAAPELRYGPKPDLGALCEALEQVALASDLADPLAALYAARARELRLEARIAEAVDTPALRALAAERFPVDETQHGERADAEARLWASLAPMSEGPRIAAEDPDDARSLLNVLRSLVGAMRLPVRVTVTPHLSSAAATGDGVIVVREGVTHRPDSARRIALHEVRGHVLPRLRARSERLGLFAVASPRGADDEEGRALLIEERSGLLDDDRRRELGLRHLVALATRRGADFVESVRLALSRDVPLADALRLVLRVHRGGGLARELVYLPALHRVRAAFAADPSLESWFERGRIGVEAARVLAGVECARAPITRVTREGGA